MRTLIVPEIPLSELTLRRHIGKMKGEIIRKSDGKKIPGIVEVDLNQSEIMLGQFRLGYIGDDAGALLLLIHSHWTPAEVEEIRTAVAKIRDEPMAEVAIPPAMDAEDDEDDTDVYETEEE